MQMAADAAILVFSLFMFDGVVSAFGIQSLYQSQQHDQKRFAVTRRCAYTPKMSDINI